MIYWNTIMAAVSSAAAPTSAPSASPVTTGMSNLQIVFSTLAAVSALIAIITGAIKLGKFISQKRNQSVNPIPKAKDIRDNLPPLGLVIGRRYKSKELYKKVKHYHMVCVQGVGGIGKTTLSIYVARKYKRRKRTHIIWVTSKTEVLTLDKILNSIAHFFDFTGIDSLELDAKRDKILRVLKQNRSLLIVDNFETIEDDTEIKAFLNAIDTNCKILITSRNNTVISQDQANLQVDNLTDKNAILLMRKELEKNGRPELSLIEYKKLLGTIGGSPLAIKWSIGQIATNGHTVDTICAQLRDGVVGSVELFEKIFAIAWQELNAIQKDILFLLQFFVTPVSAKALWKLSGLADETQFTCELSKLFQLSLIDSNAENHIERRFFSLHSLTNSFVLTELKKITNGDCGIARRVLANYRIFCAERRVLPHGREKDYGDIEREWQNIDKAIKFSIENIGRMQTPSDVKNDALEISKTINVFLWSRGYWQERIDVCKQALQIAIELGRDEEAGQLACFIGIVLFWQSKNEEAKEWATHAEKLLANSAKAKQVLAERLRGLTQLGDQQFDDAIDKLKSVFAVVSPESDEEVTHGDVAIIADWVAPSREGYKAGRVALLQEIGICYNRKGEHDNAIASLRHSESLARSIYDDEGLSISLSHLGHSMVGLGRYKEAKKAYNEGLEIALSVGRKSTTARCYEGLTRVAKKQRNLISMYINGRKAIELFERLNMQKELNDMKNIMAIKIF